MMTIQNPDPSFLQVFNQSGIEIPDLYPVFRKLIDCISSAENCQFDLLEVVYVDEQEIVRINKEFLARDYITDIISFRYDEDDSNTHIEGTLYCCAPRIEEQASEFGDSVLNEYKRIFVHGMLHLIGYDDQAGADKQKMTALEDTYLEMVR